MGRVGAAGARRLGGRQVRPRSPRGGHSGGLRDRSGVGSGDVGSDQSDGLDHGRLRRRVVHRVLGRTLRRRRPRPRSGTSFTTTHCHQRPHRHHRTQQERGVRSGGHRVLVRLPRPRPAAWPGSTASSCADCSVTLDPSAPARSVITSWTRWLNSAPMIATPKDEPSVRGRGWWTRTRRPCPSSRRCSARPAW